MRPSHLLSAFVFCAIALPLESVVAQQAPNTEVQITKLEPALIDSPRISAGGYSKKAARKAEPWLELEVTFDRVARPDADLYLQELTFNYFVLLKNEGVTVDRKPTLLTGSVTHVMIPAEKGMHSVMFLPPRMLASLFQGKVPQNIQQAVTDFGVTVTGKDGLMALATWKGTVRGDKGWWDNAAAFNTVAGLLRNKDQTPFAPLEWDFHETIKPSSAN